MKIMRPVLAISGSSLIGLPIVAMSSGVASAHEAWLLTPSEVEALSRLPPPGLFTSSTALGIASVIGVCVMIGALRAEERLHPAEAHLAAPLARAAPTLGPLAIRAGLAIMLTLSAVGGLPRQGTAPWTEPTLFVPDMQLSLAPGWDWLAAVELGLSALVVTGFLARLAALGLVALSVLGLAVFGAPFLGYAPHFIAPALMLAICGAGALSLDRLLGVDNWLSPGSGTGAGRLVERAGAARGRVRLSCRLHQADPADLAHGDSRAWRGSAVRPSARGSGLIMTGVELIAGALLALGRLTRPIALFLIGGFTFFAVTLGETPLFHANLYGAMLMLTMTGQGSRRPASSAASARLRHEGGEDARVEPRLAVPATVAVLLAALSVYAPLVNSKARPPRALFLQLPADRPSRPSRSRPGPSAAAPGCSRSIHRVSLHDALPGGGRSCAGGARPRNPRRREDRFRIRSGLEPRPPRAGKPRVSRRAARPGPSGARRAQWADRRRADHSCSARSRSRMTRALLTIDCRRSALAENQYNEVLFNSKDTRTKYLSKNF